MKETFDEAFKRRLNNFRTSANPALMILALLIVLRNKIK
jgi:hypothetical protein